MGTSSEASVEEKNAIDKRAFVSVATKEVDTAAELAAGEGELDPEEALRVRYVC